jgi:tripartite motif-containing protein 37
VHIDTLSELIPEYTIFTFKLNNFTNASGIVYSPSFLVNGIEWRLKIYPKGNGVAKDKFLSVFV